MITLDQVRADSDPSTFPVERLSGLTSAACFYAAGFYGRNDVIHLRYFLNVVLIDTDEGKLVEMAEVYPPRWVPILSDATLQAEAFQRAGFANDVVTVDPWTNEIDRCFWRLPLWLSITKKLLVIGLCRDWFESKHIQPTLEELNGWISAAHWNGAPTPPAAVELRKRSNFRGGVWWAVFEK